MPWIEQLLAIVGVMLLLAGLLWFLRGRGAVSFRALGRARSTRKLEVIERLSLTPHHSVHLVRAGSRQLLIGVSPSGCVLLESREEQESGR